MTYSVDSSIFPTLYACDHCGWLSTLRDEMIAHQKDHHAEGGER